MSGEVLLALRDASPAVLDALLNLAAGPLREGIMAALAAKGRGESGDLVLCLPAATDGTGWALHAGLALASLAAGTDDARLERAACGMLRELTNVVQATRGPGA